MSCCYCFFVKQKTASEVGIGDWSSDVCSSDRGQREDVGARDAAVEQVAADHHALPGDPAAPSPDRQRVEQRLGGVLVRAVALIEHGAIDLVRDQLHRARTGMADEDRKSVV